MLNNVLMGVSLGALVLGLVFPILAKTTNPFLAYGIVFISWPAWAIGAFTGGIVGFRQQSRWGWALCVANVLAAMATLLIPFSVS
jgi:glucose uptake protein GlcU